MESVKKVMLKELVNNFDKEIHDLYLLR